MSVIEQNNAQIQRLKDAISAAYSACDEKEATMPSLEVISNLAECIKSIQHGIPEGYVLPSETINITSNVSNKDITNGKILNVNVLPPDNYISLADILSHCTRYATGEYKIGSDTLIGNVNINFGFKPKLFLIRNYGAIITNASTYFLTSSFFMLDDSFNYFYEDENGNANYSRTTTFTYYGSSKANAGHTTSVANTFAPTASGVKGGASTNIKIKGDNAYIYYALG